MTVRRKVSSRTYNKGKSASKSNYKAGRSGRSRVKSSRKKSGSALIILYDLFAGTYFGRVTVAIFIACVFVVLNLLITGDRFSWFFALTGVELIIAAIVGWLYFLLRDEKTV